MKTMNMPGFTAEASLYETGGNYQTVRQFNLVGVSSGSGTIEAALMKLGALKCNLPCPVGSGPCTGDKNCQCCKTGCARDKDGWVFCTHDPVTLTGTGGRSTHISGSLGGFVRSR